MARKYITVKEGATTVRLSEREAEFLRLCCRDIPYKHIARYMGKTIGGVNHIREVLLEALEVRSRTGLVLWCLKTGFIKPEHIDLTIPARKKRPKAAS